MINFVEIVKVRVKAQALKDDQFDVTVLINGFRSILDEYCRKKENNELPEAQETKQQVKHKREKAKAYALVSLMFITDSSDRLLWSRLSNVLM
jgi:glycogen synthase